MAVLLLPDIIRINQEQYYYNKKDEQTVQKYGIGNVVSTKQLVIPKIATIWWGGTTKCQMRST